MRTADRCGGFRGVEGSGVPGPGRTVAPRDDRERIRRRCTRHN